MDAPETTDAFGNFKAQQRFMISFFCYGYDFFPFLDFFAGSNRYSKIISFCGLHRLVAFGRVFPGAVWYNTACCF